MNELQYRINSHIYNLKNKNITCPENYFSNCYDQFINKINNNEIYITKEEFITIIETLFNYLKLKLTKEELYLSIESYIHHLSQALILGQAYVDSNYCIDKINLIMWSSPNSVVNKVWSDIPYIKDKIYSKFEQKTKENKTKIIKIN